MQHSARMAAAYGGTGVGGGGTVGCEGATAAGGASTSDYQ